MNDDRRILAWLAVLLSVLCCAPVACGAGFLLFAGTVTYFDASRRWESLDTGMFVVVFVATAVATIVGLGLAVWGVMSLLRRDSSSNQEPLDPSQDIIG